MGYAGRLHYTTEILLKVHFRYNTTDIPKLLPIRRVHEMYLSDQTNDIIADISLSDLISNRALLNAKDVFLCNIPIFFADRPN